MRLQKYLSERGVASRRAAGQLVEQGRVKVNEAVVCEPGHRVDPATDRVEVDGRLLETARESIRTILLHKPRGYICSTTTRVGGAPTIYALLGSVQERLVPAGRLDKDSEGLVVLSNDGDLVLALTHPRHGHRKTYEVDVAGSVEPPTLARLRSRLTIDGYRIRPVQVERLNPSKPDGPTRLQFILREGRNRQIRKMCELVGLRILRLQRVAIGSLQLVNLQPGHWRDVTPEERLALTTTGTTRT